MLLWGLSKNDFYDFRFPERLKLDMKRGPQRNALQIIFGRSANGRGHLWKHQQKQICGLGVFNEYATKLSAFESSRELP